MTTRKLFVPMALCLTLLLTLAVPAAAQGSRSIKGKVTDENGEGIPDVQIQILGMDIYRDLKTKTNKKGEYLYMLGLQSGVFRVVARKEGYLPEYQENIRPMLGEDTIVDFTLTPGKDQKLPFEMTQEEIDNYKKQLEIQKKREKFSAEVKEHFENGVKLTDQEMYDEALVEFNKALELSPEQPGIIARVAEIYSKQGKYEEALANYEKAIELSPSDPIFYTNKGVVLSKMGKVEESRAAFKKAAEMDPVNAAQNYYNLGVTLVNSGNTNEAAEAFKQALVADPNYAEAYYQLGMSLSGNQETIPDAIKALEKYIQIGQRPEQVEVAKQIISALGG
jgi:tetratricopeptide (TPR) repeat protein